MARKRKTSLYVSIICNRLSIARFPEGFVKWAVLRSALYRAIKRTHGILAKDICGLEGIAGAPNPTDYDAIEDAALIPKLEAAYSGDAERFAAFFLFQWNEETSEFDLYRRPLKGEG